MTIFDIYCGMIKVNLGLHFALNTPINFMLKKKYRLKDGVWRIPKWLFIILFILRLHVAWCLPSSLRSKKYVGWKKLFENFQESCLVHDNLIRYLSRRKEGFQSIFLPDPSKQVSAHEDIRFGGICCLKKSKLLFSSRPSWYLNRISLFIQSLHIAWFLLKKTYGFEEKIVWRIPRVLFYAWPS